MRIITGKYIVTLYFYWLIGKLFEIHIRDTFLIEYFIKWNYTVYNMKQTNR